MFDDHSKYKSNELNSYLQIKRLKEYVDYKSKSRKIHASPIVAGIFSAIFSATFWSLKEEIIITEPIYNKLFTYIVFPFTIAFVYLFAYVFYLYIIHPKMLRPLFDMLESWRLSKGDMSHERYTPFDQESPLEKFNKETVNQVSIALSITSNIDDKKVKFEDKYYANEALRYIDEALISLQDVIDRLNLEIKSEDNLEIRKSRLESLINICKLVLNKSRVYFDQSSADDIKFIRKIQTNIELIENDLSTI